MEENIFTIASSQVALSYRLCYTTPHLQLRSHVHRKTTEHIEKPHYYKAIALFIDNTSAIVDL
jgi:hypothetical protein